MKVSQVYRCITVVSSDLQPLEVSKNKLSVDFSDCTSIMGACGQSQTYDFQP